MSKLTLTALLSLLLCNACLMQPASSNISELEAADHSPFPILVGKSTSTRWFWLWETGDSSVDLAQKIARTHVFKPVHRRDSARADLGNVGELCARVSAT